MPRVVLFSTDAALTAESVLDQTKEWTGEPLELVWISLAPVAGTTPFEPADGWPRAIDPGHVPGWSAPAGPPGSAPSAAKPSAGKPSAAKPTARKTSVGKPSAGKLTRKQAEALAVEQGRQLWAAVEDHAQLAALVEAADALAAVDLGGVRTAYHLARRHQVAIATHGLVPCLVELDARARAGAAG